MDEQWLRLFERMEFGDSAELKPLLETYRGDFNLQNEEGSSLLHEAVCCRAEAIVKMLTEKKDVNINIRDKGGRTALWMAACLGYKAGVELLLEIDRIDPEARDDHGQTPLSAAVMMGRSGISLSAATMGQESVVEMLLASRGVAPDAKDDRGLTPLAWASRDMESIRIVKSLLSTGRVDVNSKDELGITPLMWAAASYNEEVKELLLNSGRLDRGLNLDRGAGDVSSRYITHWIDSCDAQHGGQCQPAPLEHKLPQLLPHWVIDISRACLVPGNTVSRYVALSYVWSRGFSVNAKDYQRSSDGILLKKKNLPDFKTPGYLEGVLQKLPTPVKDAIALVREIGEIYLWVDCLCIVQDDEKTREQVDHMGDIYSGAYMSIIAATPRGTLHGPPSPNHRFKRNEKVEDLYANLHESTWATRGWTFQEQMLSRRAVIFSSGYMFWECQKGVWSPDGPRPETSTARSASFTVPHYEKARRMLCSCYPDFDLYTEDNQSL
ncbi:hypothetical protein J4E90_001518 [Alternaria incomplexa]|uniref:uncharacterized protein n=1 Tax=Alternaria incomplexa TaxID=1187928 RepID=UPI00221EF33C|nr:uncharacterized protein J4E90_001518 [Alternaria incomplexa]KAI4919384.1 hypothetical protein J4E90_001518 [Alternaria incomplexa]